MKRILAILTLLIASVAFATDYTQDANCLGAYFLNGPSNSIELNRSGTDTLVGGVVTNWNRLRNTFVPTDYAGVSQWFRGGYLVASDTTVLNINGANAKLSVCAWIYPDSTPGNNVIWVTVSKYLTTSNNKQYRLGITGITGGTYKIGGWVSNNGSTVGEIHSTTTTFTDSAWHHVVLTSDDANLMLYIDGDTAATAVAWTAGIASKAGRFSIGSQYNGLGLWMGYIDEVAVFDSALTYEEVQEIYTYGLTGDSANSDVPFYTEFINADGTPPADSDLYDFIHDSLASLCDSNLTWNDTTFGVSGESRDIIGVEIVPEGYTQTIVFDAGIHGNIREGLGSYALLELFHWLADTSFPRIRFAALMMTNPDGVSLSQRKNNNVDSSRSVSINHNFSWGWDTLGTADSATYKVTTSSEYKGPYAFSEPESQALRDFILGYAPDMWINIHASSNMIFVNGAAAVAGAQLPNTYLANNGFEPYVNVNSSYTGAGYPFTWGWGVAGCERVYGYELNVCSTDVKMEEQTNRLIAYVSYQAGYLSFIPVVTSVTSTLCPYAVLAWSADSRTDCLRVLRRDSGDFSRIATVAVADSPYTDTLSSGGNYSYSLIAFETGGEISDTSDAFDFILITPPSAARSWEWGGHFSTWGNW